MLIETKNINEARKQIEKAFKEKKKVIVKAQNPEFNRKILENKKVSVLLSPELTGEIRKEKLKERDSGLNEVLCRIAAKNKIAIGIDIKEILKTKEKERAILLSRVMQNIKLCKKTGAEIKVFGNYDEKNLFSLFSTLGASNSQIRKAIEA